jgi:WD40 repeat protein
MNFVLDRDKLVARRKVVPGAPERSPLFRRVAAGKMPPPGEGDRLSPSDVALLRRWIEAGAPSPSPGGPPVLLTDAAVFDLVLTDLEKLDRRARRFTRYFTLHTLANAGALPGELQTYRNALAKLVNSLSWHPRLTLPRAVDANGLVLRIDLRDFQWDANLWNRVLTDYPYGVVHDTAVARAVLVATATRMPVVRADWFVATASRAPLYYEMLQIPSNLSELERQLRVDVAANIQQERVTRLGFNGSGVSRNNRVLERHDSMNGSYWRSYDFESVPQNLIERNILLPDRRNIFAYPLGPGLGENGFLPAGGEVIFDLPNGLHGYVLVNGNGVRVDRAPTAIVSDPRRPDRAVEAGVSCMNCHATGILPKDDQIRDHVWKNRKAFSRADAELVQALYPPAKKTRAQMEADAERFRKAVVKTGNRPAAAEPVMAMTLRFEADVDLPTLAAEAGLEQAKLLPHLTATENLSRNLGALKVPGATVSRQVVAQSFGDLVKEMRLGVVFQPGTTGELLPDATGELDPLEAQSSPANAMDFTADGKLAALASNDKTVRLIDLVTERDLRRMIGHTASLWAVAFSPDGTQILSGGKDGSVRLWDVDTGRELKKLDGHLDLVSAVVFSPDGKRALSAGYDHEVILWDLDKGERVEGFSFRDGAKYVHSAAFSPDGRWALLAADRSIYLLNGRTGKVIRKIDGHTSSVTQAVFSRDGTRILSASDDGTVRLWDSATGKQLRLFRGHEGYVKSVALSPDGKQALSGGSDATVRLWDVADGKQLRVFRKHTEPLVAVRFRNEKWTLSGSRDAVVLPWRIGGVPVVKTPNPVTPRPPDVTPAPGPTVPLLRPLAIVPVGGTVGGLALAPDGKALYYFNRTENTLGRLEAKGYGRARPVLLAEGTDTLGLSPDGKWLVATTVVRERDTVRTKVQTFDPDTLAVRKSFWVDAAAYDLAVGERGLAFVTGATGDWTDLTAIDLKKGAVAGRWGGVWVRSFLRLSGDGRRIYFSSQGVAPGTLDALVIPTRFDDRPAVYRAPAYEKNGLGGEFTISPDGKYLLSRSGTVLRLAPEREEDMRLHVKLPPFLAAAVDVEGRAAYVLGRDGELRQYSYPDFRPAGTYRLSLSGYALVVDGKNGRLYVAGFDPAAVAERPRARGHGDIHVYDLAALRRAVTAAR